MYTIRINANTTPYSDGWGDPVMIYNGNGEVVFSGIGSTCPNTIKPSNRESWKRAYGWIKEGIYNVKTVVHPKYGRCVIINNGGFVLARYPNVNHKGDCILNEVFIHEGNRGSSNPLHRGSAGCPTLHPAHWKQFQESLPDGSGMLIISDCGDLSC